ncbi:MAG: polysaccharide biosynthesis tyrosine autokinase [Cyanobacteriota bacterium]|nr:polysaccharide biosynthesis tyrosine autokinase [Cyanobacteriota bacterium]
MTPLPPGTELETDLGYGQLFAILLRRRLWIVTVLTSTLLATILITLRTKPTYKSQMQLLVEPNYPARTNLSQTGEETQTSEEDYATQLTLMRSSQFAEKAAQLLKDDYPSLQGSAIEKRLDLSQVVEDKTETRIFEAIYTDTDPLKTQQVLQALQKVYQNYNLQQEKLRLTQGLAVITRQSEAARDRLARVEGDLKQFRTNQNLIDPEQEAQAAAEALNTIEKERQAIQAQYQETQARYQSLRNQLQLSAREALNASRLSQSDRYQSLLNELQKTELALAEQRVQFTDESAPVQELLEQRSRQLQLLQQERQRVAGSASSDSTDESLRRQGQFADIELDLAGKLLETNTQLQSLEARDRVLAETQQQLRAELNRYPNLIAEYNRLQPEVEIQQNTIKQLLETRQNISQELARGGFNWQVVESPQPGRKIAPEPKKNLMLGTVVGLFLGGVAAFAREALDDAVRSSDELKQKVALPLLGIIPQLPQPKTSSRLVTLFSQSPRVELSPLETMYSWQPFRESLDLIYKNIQLLAPPSKLRALLVSSACAGEGKSTLALGLASSAARLHKKVLLIDADLRRPSLHQRLCLPNDRGLSMLLEQQNAPPSPQTVATLDSVVDVLTAGPAAEDPVKLLSSQRMQELMRSFESAYDLVLLDTPPILGLVDVMQTASICDGAVIAARLDRTTQAELNQAIVMLRQFNILGIVANGAKSESVPYRVYANRNGNRQEWN